MTKKLLADVNIWIALIFQGHVNHSAVRAYFDSLAEDSICFCRMTQQGFFRLATDRRIMGDDAVTMEHAWRVYDQLLDDVRLAPMLEEPPGIEAPWRAQTSLAVFTPKVWNDAYLAAFAALHGLEILTLDKGMGDTPA